MPRQIQTNQEDQKTQLAHESIETCSREQCVARVLGMVFAAVSAGFGLLALIGWIARVPLLTTFAAGKIPMAPSTALLFTLFGTAIFLHARMPQIPGARRICLAFGLSGTLAALLLLPLSLLGVRPAAEHLGMQIPATLHGMAIGHISPLTALCFVLAGFSLLALLWSSPGRRWLGTAASCFASLVILTSAALLLGYLMGVPLLYDTGFIPPALTSCMAFLMLGTALMLSSVDWAWLSEGRSDALSNRTARRLILIFVVASVCILTTGYLYFRGYEQQFRNEVGRQLLAIGKLKSDGLVNWRKERIGDAGLFYKNIGFTDLVHRYFDSPQDASAEEQLYTWLSRVASHSDCDRVSLLDARGRERMSVPAKDEAMDPPIARDTAKVLQSGKVDFQDFYRCKNDNSIYLAILVPVFTGRHNRIVGVLALCIDPHEYLYPYISSWPTPSRTSETLLVRRDGNDAIFLNELRFRKNTALKMRIPLDKKEVPAVKAALGQAGVVEGLDYRGVSVVAAMRAVPGSPWSLVAKMDTSEVYAPLRKRLWEIIGLIGVLLIGTGASLGLLWRQQSVRFYREKSAAAEVLRESEERLSTTLNSIGDAVISTDANGRVLGMNPVAEELTGWTISDAIACPISEVLNIINALTGEPAPIPVDDVLATGEVRHLANHTTLISRDGTQRQIADSAAPIRDDSGAIIGVVLVFSDVTEQYRIREALREQGDRAQRYLDIAGVILVSLATDGTVALINKQGCALLGYSQQELLGRSWFDFCVPERNRQEVKAAFTQLMRGDCEPVEFFENAVITRSGEERMVSWHNVLMLDATGAINGTLSSGDDVTERKQAEEALRDSESRLRAITESAQDAILMMDPEGLVSYWNLAAERILGYTCAEAIGQNLHSFIVPPRYHEAHQAALPAFRQTGQGSAVGKTLDMEARRKDGKEISVQLSLSTIEIKGVWHAVGILRDITESKQLTAQLESAATQVNSLMTQVVTGNSFTGRFTNPSLSRCWEVKKCTKTDCPAYHNDENLRCWEIAGTFCGHEVQGVFAQKYGDCSLCEVYRSARVNPILELGETFNTMAAILENRLEALEQAKSEISTVNRQLVSALNQANQLANQAEQAREQIEEHAVELSHQATHDALTGLPNRKHFEQHLSELITGSASKKSRPLGMLFLDLDKFKLINDTLGHKAGDLLLVEVAKRLQSCLRPGDLLARMGGDEFTVIVMRCKDRSVAESVAARMIESISKPFEIQGHRFVTGMSIGLARYPSDAADAVTLIKYADAAMYKAKESGRNNCQIFSEEMSRQNQSRVEMEQDLRLAIERCELEVYYQPIVDIKTMRLAGAEALLRWNHPKKGMISPGLFMPVAEETGLIVQIGKTVLETACEQCKSWHDAGYSDLEISVNVSPIQLCDIRFIAEVDNALSRPGLSSRYLKLEVIETVLARNDNDELDILSILRSLGISICIDDFGMGYSSLSRLNDLPIDHLKIDGHFIRNIELNKKDRAMAESIIVLAHNLGMQVTAEWVEDEKQLAIVESLYCDYAQGYLVSPALSAEAFVDFVREWKPMRRAA